MIPYFLCKSDSYQICIVPGKIVSKDCVLIISQRYYLQDGGVGVEIVQDFAGFGIEG